MYKTNYKNSMDLHQKIPKKNILKKVLFTLRINLIYTNDF